MNKVTCYKLLYALGVTDTELNRDFRLEHKAASYSTYFMPGPSLLRFRADAAIFNFVVNNFYRITSVDALLGSLDSLRLDVECLRHFNRRKIASDVTVAGALQTVVYEHNNLCRRAYQELECAIPYFAFLNVVELPSVSAQRLSQLAFIASKTERLYGLQFPGKDVLSVAIGAMFQSDLALRDRLALLTGSRLDSIADRSQMGSAVDAFIQSAFVCSKDLRIYKRMLFYEGQPKNALPMRQLLSELEDFCPDMEIVPLVSETQFQDVSVVLSADTKWVAEQSLRYPRVQFYVPLPIESKYYKPWKSRKVPNVFLVNRSSSG